MCLASQLLALLPSGNSLSHVFGVLSPGSYYFLAFITLTCTFYLKGPKTGLKGVLQTLKIKKWQREAWPWHCYSHPSTGGEAAHQVSHRGCRTQNQRAADPRPGAANFNEQMFASPEPISMCIS